MQKLSKLYEGRDKLVFATDDPEVLIVYYKDDFSEFKGLKKSAVNGKGAINNRMSNLVCLLLEDSGIPTHFVREISERETAVKKAEIIPLEVIVRNKAAGRMAKRLDLEEGKSLLCPVFELTYKDDDLGDPLIGESHALACGFCSRNELEMMRDYALKANEVLRGYFAAKNVELIDFKLEFGRYKGEVILTDEISPDTCRFWDMKTGEKLDKDRFRGDLGSVREAYEEIARRLGIL